MKRTKSREVITSAVWAVGISAPISLWGWSASMGLVHTGGPLLILFAPAILVLILFGSGGVFPGLIPEWFFIMLCAVAQFAGTFAVVYVIRRVRALRAQNGG